MPDLTHSRVKLHVSVGRFCMTLRVLNAVKIARQLLAASFKALVKSMHPTLPLPLSPSHAPKGQLAQEHVPDI